MLIKGNTAIKSIRKYNYQTFVAKNQNSVNPSGFLLPDSENTDVAGGGSLDQIGTELTTPENEFKIGFHQGEKAGYEKGRKSVQPHIESFVEIITAMQNQQQEVINQAEQFVLNLALKIVEKILGCEELLNAKIDKTKLQQIVKEAMNQFSNSKKYNIRLHRDTAEVLEGYKPEILEKLPSQVELSITEDSSLKPGDCLVESEQGVLDARIETQLNKIKDVFILPKTSASTDTL
jgi:flagellar biosynthesis/type III secretory pathway protein FliH